MGIIVQALTDKKARTTPEIKSIVTKHGCSLAEPNSVKRLFQYRGDIIIEKTQLQKDLLTEDDLMEIAIEAGAEDIETFDEYYEILTLPGDFSAVTEALQEKGVEFVSAEVRYIPMQGTEVEISDSEKLEKLQKLIDIFEENEDVQAVYHNYVEKEN